MDSSWTDSVLTLSEEVDGEDRADEISYQVIDVFGDELAKRVGAEVRKTEDSIILGEEEGIAVRVVPLGIPVSDPQVPHFLVQLIALTPEARAYIDEYYTMLLTRLEHYAGTQGRPYKSVVGRVTVTNRH